VLRKQKGICRLCGAYKKLTFEHIPPRSAFNEQPLVLQTLQNMLEGQSHTKFRRGLGEYSLCANCNNRTGAWYGKAFVDWVRQGLEWLSRLPKGSSLELPYWVMPLNVIKQIIVMALAMTPEATVSHQDELRRFVLNRYTKYLPPEERVYVYFNLTGQPRFTSGMAVVNVKDRGGAFVRAEVALPPFGYCVCTPLRDWGLIPESKELCDITWFSRFDYNSWTRVFLRLQIRETHLPFPLDYRTQAEIEKETRESEMRVRSPAANTPA